MYVYYVFILVLCIYSHFTSIYDNTDDVIEFFLLYHLNSSTFSRRHLNDDVIDNRTNWIQRE